MLCGQNFFEFFFWNHFQEKRIIMHRVLYYVPCIKFSLTPTQHTFPWNKQTRNMKNHSVLTEERLFIRQTRLVYSKIEIMLKIMIRLYYRSTKMEITFKYNTVKTKYFFPNTYSVLYYASKF